jgi:hypothetical protein
MSSHKVKSWSEPSAQATRNFHLGAGCVCAATFIFSLIGSHISAIETSSPVSLVFALLLCVGAVLPVAVYWHDKCRPEMREAILTIAWAMIVIFTLPPAVLVLGRIGTPLQDELFVRMDQALGVSVPAITAWSAQHLAGRIISATYPLLFLLIPVAIIAPAVTGRWAVARQFIIANIVAYLIGFTIFAIAPAVGPWYGFHFTPDAGQRLCQAELLALRAPGPFVPQTPGIVCCPSFHVIWAILSACALWNIRTLRIPASLLAFLIVLSTITTGWHYFTDVLAGIGVALFAQWSALRLCASAGFPRKALLSNQRTFVGLVISAHSTSNPAAASPAPPSPHCDVSASPAEQS